MRDTAASMVYQNLSLYRRPHKGPTPDFGFNEGRGFSREISQQEYEEMYNAVPWTWTADGQ